MAPSVFQVSFGKTGETEGREDEGRKGKKEEGKNEDKATATVEGQVTDKLMISRDTFMCRLVMGESPNQRQQRIHQRREECLASSAAIEQCHTNLVRIYYVCVTSMQVNTC